MITRTELINHLIKKYKFKSFLEIGVRNPKKGNFCKVKCKKKIGVDPDPIIKMNEIYVGTSDEYFKNLNNDEKFDIIFIDGLHLEEQVDKDIKNSLNHLSKNGFILLHDCNPPTEFHQRKEYCVNGRYPSWNGTVWRSIAKLRMNNKRLKIHVVDTDWGVGVIKPGKQKIFKTDQDLTYKLLEDNRKELLNLISTDEFFSNI